MTFPACYPFVLDKSSIVLRRVNTLTKTHTAAYLTSAFLLFTICCAHGALYCTAVL